MSVTSKLDRHLCETIRAVDDLSRMLEAVRYTTGLGKGQIDRIVKAKKAARDAEAFLSTLGAA